jgi:hypothetical protein
MFRVRLGLFSKGLMIKGLEAHGHVTLLESPLPYPIMQGKPKFPTQSFVVVPSLDSMKGIQV